MALVRKLIVPLVLSFVVTGASGQQQGASASTPAAQTTTPAPKGVLLHGSGKYTVNGQNAQTMTSVFDADVVQTAQTPVRFSTEGNTLVFTPDSNFKAEKNAYRLEKGGSRVASYTGMTAEVNCFSVTPVNPVYMTLYEVNWQDSAVWVYARSEDVYIHQHNGDAVVKTWRLKEGDVARIREARLCKPLVDLYPVPEAPYAVGFGAWSAAVVLAETYPWHKQKGSPDTVTTTH